MDGVQAYDLGGFHRDCKDVRVIDVGGFMQVYCADCRIVSNLQAVAPKFADYKSACLPHARSEATFNG